MSKKYHKQKQMCGRGVNIYYKSTIGNRLIEEHPYSEGDYLEEREEREVSLSHHHGHNNEVPTNSNKINIK